MLSTQNVGTPSRHVEISGFVAETDLVVNEKVHAFKLTHEITVLFSPLYMTEVDWVAPIAAEVFLRGWECALPGSNMFIEADLIESHLGSIRTGCLEVKVSEDDLDFIYQGSNETRDRWATIPTRTEANSAVRFAWNDR